MNIVSMSEIATLNAPTTAMRPLTVLIVLKTIMERTGNSEAMMLVQTKVNSYTFSSMTAMEPNFAFGCFSLAQPRAVRYFSA